ncbi:Alpha/Beta hydrolase protein [Flammula alnicola]|nr:Alpha/Beta hydrolase protein [Flammula alnicola]
MYDNNPPYPHYDHLPYAKEPWKSIYVYQRLFTTLALVPIWIVYYSIAPRSIRPRASWNLRQVINVNFTRRIYKVTEVAGVTWGTRDPTVAADEKSLKETRFEWVKPLPEEFRTGIVKEGASFTEVGCYVWPKQVNPAIQKIKNLKNPPEDTQHLPSTVDLEAGTDDVPIVGIFMHGGGYCHMSAHEKSRTSRIPRNLVKKNIMQEVYSVEYRLLQHSPFPAVVQDAAAVYAHVVEQYGIRKSKCKLVLIGDSSGGNLVLSLTRWIRDEGHLPLPHGLLLLSPSCDASHALPETLSSHIPRPNSRTDYLVDTPEPRALLQRTFLGFKHPGPYTPEEERRFMEVVHSEYVSPCSPIVLERWGHETKQDPEGEFVGHVFERLPLTAPAVTPTASTASQIPLLAGVVNDVNADPIDLDNPYYKSRRFPKLFGDFPRTMVVCGDAERLVREVGSLIAAMETDGVDLTVHWAQDACHDPLLLSDFWWDRRVLAEIWRAVEAWSTSFEEGAGANKSAGPSSAGSSQDSGIAAAKDVKE